MGRPNLVIDAELRKEMQARAAEWSSFRAQNLLSQKFLAEIIGVSRRTVQHVETEKHIPHQRVIDAFEKLQKKYAAEGKPTGKKKQKAA